MTIFEAYLFLLFDSILDALAFVPNSTMVYKVMLIFGGYNIALMFLISLLGSAIGVSINYLLGKAFSTVKKAKFGNSKKFDRLIIFSQKKLYWLSILSFMPIFGIISTCFLGMMKVSFRKFILFALIGRAIYYTLLFLL